MPVGLGNLGETLRICTRRIPSIFIRQYVLLILYKKLTRRFKDMDTIVTALIKYYKKIGGSEDIPNGATIADLINLITEATKAPTNE
jgi:hypothetical protein